MEDGRSGQSPHLPSQKPLRRDLLLVLVYDRNVNPLFGVICEKSGLDPFLTLEFGVCHAVSLSPSSPCVGLRLTARRGCEDQRPRSCGVRPLPGGAERTVGSPSRRPRGARGPSCVAALSVSRGTRRGERGRAGRAVLTASVWLTALSSLWRHHQGDHDEDETERQAAQRAVPAPVPAAGECLPAPRRGPHRGDTPPRHRCPSRPSRAHTPPPGHRLGVRSVLLRSRGCLPLITRGDLDAWGGSRARAAWTSVALGSQKTARPPLLLVLALCTHVGPPTCEVSGRTWVPSLPPGLSLHACLAGPGGVRCPCGPGPGAACGRGGQAPPWALGARALPAGSGTRLLFPDSRGLCTPATPTHLTVHTPDTQQ